VTFVTRAEWGAQYAQGSSRIPGPVYGVTLHWEGPHMGTWPHADCAAKVRVIERFHAVTRGWAGIAYTLVVCPHGDVFEGRGVGIRSAANGESAIGGNDHWYAVCYLGGQGDGFTKAGRAGVVEAVRYLRKHGAGAKVNGHRDHHPTECPGDTIYRWLQAASFDAPEPRRKPSRGTNIDHAVNDLIAAAKANRDKPVRFRRIKAALAHLTKIKEK
jgi:hypothetical protein